ncbi:protein of unknown function [Pseudodesulfovibrio piezophilus C1TLV30]|uniref:Uncharacterized protein n=1 Tax=Pseudodesulfovibrio piezophilus (strain DSM 21447 / JCM 15486 / C1TLV30) TaxID=1322246 RepID=M1WN57_PSEP2|nr:protein of unknown function [Pseudodesulfovibrio piezophilus C1TLV30]
MADNTPKTQAQRIAREQTAEGNKDTPGAQKELLAVSGVSLDLDTVDKMINRTGEGFKCIL